LKAILKQLHSDLGDFKAITQHNAYAVLAHRLLSACAGISNRVRSIDRKTIAHRLRTDRASICGNSKTILKKLRSDF
jgi:hypothetical protein